MSRPRHLPWIVVLALLVSACCGNEEAICCGEDEEEVTQAKDLGEDDDLPSGADCTVLAEVPGPEDFVVQKGKGYRADRLLVSSRDRRNDAEGTIYRVSLREKTGTAEKMELRGRGGCSFRPHGVYLHGDKLYVINHHEEAHDRSADRSCVPKADGIGARSTSIEIFEVGWGSLTLEQRLTNPELLDNANDLVVAEDGTVYVTVPPTNFQLFQESAFGQAHSKVVRYDPNGSPNWTPFAVLSGYPNGIEIVGADPVGEELEYDVVVSTSMEGKVYRFGQDGRQKPVPTSPFPKRFRSAHDNFTWHRKGEEGQRLLLATHRERRRFVQHSLNEGARSPSQVWSLAPGLSEKTLAFEDDGTLVSGVSTAACAGDRLILGQVFGPAVLSCQSAVCTRPEMKQVDSRDPTLPAEEGEDEP